LLIIGVDSSRPKNESNKTLVAMTASLNGDFSKFFNKKLEIEETTKHILLFPISTFIYESCLEYFKINNKLPGGIIIYRQGVSREQRFYLNAEIEQIDKLLKGQGDYEINLKIPYYYILVNKKTSLKFFECEGLYNANNVSNVSTNKENLNLSNTSRVSVNSTNVKSVLKSSQVNYENPDPGLLIYGGITDPDIFEFYIQPQKVSQGTATPTNFHVAFGNLNIPELIPKLTYDLCYLYCNWRGPVRVPAPLKYAEKLSKTIPQLNDKTKNKLYYI
jgi:aubergine-like protein